MNSQEIDTGWGPVADELFGRIAAILEAARGQIVHAVNHATVVSY